MKAKLVVITFLFCLFSVTANAAEFRVLDLKYTMPTDVPWVRVITNQSDWEIFYRELLTSNGYAANERPPRVNFKSKQVLVAGVGVRYNNVGRLVVSHVDAGWDLEKITVNLLDMEPECTLPHSVIHPMVAVVVPKLRDKEVDLFIEEATTAVCNFS
ncbi:MAG: hypothetical protein ABW098_14165 [Candidatus Thiodiazotropha sp.]